MVRLIPSVALFFSSLALTVSTNATANASVTGGSCNTQLLNSVANCISAKSTFLTTRNLTYVGSVLSSAGGAIGVDQLRKNFADYLLANRAELIRLAAQQGQIDWADDWKKDAEGARAAEAKVDDTKLRQLLSEGKDVVGWPGDGKNRFPPRLREVDGIMYDIANIADVDIDLLPEKFHGANKSSAQIAIDEAIEQLKQGKPLDHNWKMNTGSKIHDAWLILNEWAKDHPVQGKSFSEMVKMSVSEPDLSLRAEAKANVALDLRRIDGVSAALSHHARTKGASGLARLVVGRTAVSDISKIVAAAIGPIVSGGLLAVEIGGDTTFEQISCLSKTMRLPKKDDMIPGLSLRVREIINISFERGCHPKKPEYMADERVLNFLIASDEEKEAALKVPEVCEFYQQMKQTVCSPAKLDLQASTCTPDSREAKLLLVSKDGKKLRLDVSFDSTGKVDSIRGPTLNGYSYNKAENSWYPYSVPVSARRSTLPPPPSAWVRYDDGPSPLVGAQKKIFGNWVQTDGWDIAANFGAIESFVSACANPIRNALPQHSKEPHLAR